MTIRHVCFFAGKIFEMPSINKNDLKKTFQNIMYWHPIDTRAFHSDNGTVMINYQRYGRVSDQELISGIDKLSMDHGSTEVLTANSKC